MFSNPAKNLRALGLRETDIVADLGAGTGYYSLVLGPLVPEGKVYAIEISREYAGTIRQRVADANLHNVEIIVGNVEKPGGTQLGDHIADAVIASNILFQVDDAEAFIKEIKRILAPAGKVLLVDWSENSIFKDIPIVPEARARELFEKAGFALLRKIDAGDHHYGMIWRMADVHTRL